MSNEAVRKRKPNTRSREKRDRIASSAVEIVDERGHENVTTSLVAERSGVAEATILYHFPTRDHILIAAQRAIDEESRFFNLHGIGLDEEASFDLEKFATYEGSDDNRSRLFLMIKGMSTVPGHPAADYYATRLSEQIQLFSALVRGSIATDGAHPDVDPDAAARQIIALWEGLNSMWMCDRTFSVGPLLAAGIRRIIGQNVMELRDALNRPGAGL